MHLSYTSLVDADACPHRFKLKYIDKIKTFTNSIDTIFGNLMHECVQGFLMHKRTKDETRKYFFRWWKTFYKIYKKHLDDKKTVSFLRAGLNCLSHLDTSFEDCEALTVEEKLYMPISEDHPNIGFKGYIDLVMFKGNSLVIADLKTTGSSFMFEKYLDDIKRFQLVYYKNYYAQKYDIDPSEIDVYFITLEKAPTSKQPIRFIQDSPSPRLVKESKDLINRTIDKIERGEFVKNRNACINTKTKIQCPFLDTAHCPKEID